MRLANAQNFENFRFATNDVSTMEQSAFEGTGMVYADLTKTTITSLPKFAFRSCSSLVRVDYPSSLKTIEEKAFSSSGIQSLILPEGVESIGEQSYSGCSDLAYVRLPSTLLSIGSLNFYMNEKLTYLDIPEKVTSLSGIFWSTYLGNGTADAAQKTVVVRGDISNVYTGSSQYQYKNYIIYGKTGTALETFADNKGLEFHDIAVDSLPTPPTEFIPEIPEEEEELRELKVTRVSDIGTYIYDTDHSVEIKSSGTYRIEMSEGITSTKDIIAVNAPDGSEVTVILDGVNIAASDGIMKYSYGDQGQLTIYCGVHEDCGETAKTDCGTLEVSGSEAPAIGSYNGNQNTGNIRITSGHIIAKGGSYYNDKKPYFRHPVIGSLTAEGIEITGGIVRAKDFGKSSPVTFEKCGCGWGRV